MEWGNRGIHWVEFTMATVVLGSDLEWYRYLGNA